LLQPPAFGLSGLEVGLHPLAGSGIAVRRFPGIVLKVVAPASDGRVVPSRAAGLDLVGGVAPAPLAWAVGCSNSRPGRRGLERQGRGAALGWSPVWFGTDHVSAVAIQPH
jgi:hypothetical protein